MSDRDREHGFTDEVSSTTDPVHVLGQLPQPTVTGIVELLNEPRRAAVIEFLLKTEGESATLEELVEYTSGKEDPTAEMTRPSLSENIAISLHHHHLPQMEHVGLISYSHESGIVRYLPTNSVSSSETEKNSAERGN